MIRPTTAYPDGISQLSHTLGQPITNTILLSICLCQILVPSSRIIHRKYTHSTCHKHHTTEYLLMSNFCSFIENTLIQSITNTILLSICLCQILVPFSRIIHRKYAHSIYHKHHTTEYLFMSNFGCLHSGSFIENTHIQPVTNTILLSICLCQILVPLSRIIQRKYAHSTCHKHHTTEYLLMLNFGAFVQDHS